MYPISDELLEQLHKPVQRYYLRGNIDGRSFDSEDILGNTLTIEGQCTDNTDLTIGGVYISTLKTTLLSTLTVAFEKGTWKGREVTVEVGVELEDLSVEWIPMGVFTIDRAEWEQTGLNIVAYDHMQRFDKPLQFTETVGTPYALLSIICNACGVELGMEEADLADFPNGEEQISMYSTNDVETYRDMLFWIAQTLGSFATMNRYGELVIRKFSSEPDIEYPASERFSGPSFSDFYTLITGISIVNIEDQTTRYYGLTEDNGSTYNLGSNPFIQYGLDSTREQMCRAILEALNTYQFTPFRAETLNNPALDLGDCILFSGGIAEDYKCSVMHYTFSFARKTSYSGVGSDPALSSAKSKVDKDLSGLVTAIEANAYSYFKFQNSELIELGSEPTKVAQIRFATKNTSDINIWSEFKMLTDFIYEEDEEGELVPTTDTIKAHVYYYLNGELISYEPIETWSENDYHILNLMYLLKEVEPNTSQLWEVYIAMDQGKATIEVGDGNLALGGRGLLGAEEWTGYIEVEDSIPLYAYTGLASVTIGDTLDLVEETADIISKTEFIRLYAYTGISTETFEDELVFNVKYASDDIWRAGQAYSGDTFDDTLF